MGGRDLLGLGAMLAGAVVGCTVLGLVIDHVAGSSPVGVIVGVAVGMALGALGFVLRVRRALYVPTEHPDGPRNEVRP